MLSINRYQLIVIVIVALRLTPVAHSALFLPSLKTTLFDRGWAGSAPEQTSLKGRYIKLLKFELELE